MLDNNISPVLVAIGLAISVRAHGASLCLSDGQLISGIVTEREGHVVVSISDKEVRVPLDSMGEDCSSIRALDLSSPENLRTVTLLDGQQLHGWPTPLSYGLQLRLLDRQPIVITAGLVGSVEQLKAGIPALEPALEAARAQRRRSATGGVATGVWIVVGTGAVVATLTGVTFILLLSMDFGPFMG